MIYSKKYIEYDLVFLKEITELIIANLTELNEDLDRGIRSHDLTGFLKNLHQSKITLSLIGNSKLLAKAEQMSKTLKVKSVSREDLVLLESFQRVCNQEIKNLYARLTYYENYLVGPSNIN